MEFIKPLVGSALISDVPGTDTAQKENGRRCESERGRDQNCRAEADRKRPATPFQRLQSTFDALAKADRYRGCYFLEAWVSVEVWKTTVGPEAILCFLSVLDRSRSAGAFLQKVQSTLH